MEQGNFKKAGKRAIAGGSHGKIDTKLCPFMSTPDKQVGCTPQCQLYRAEKEKLGFMCPFAELQAISWSLRGR